MYATISVDKFSFPSGHATRAVALALFFGLLLPPLNFFVMLPITAWSFAVCLSRVLLGRHHLLDVAAGIAIGIVEAILLRCILIGPEMAGYIGESLFGEDPWSSA